MFNLAFLFNIFAIIGIKRYVFLVPQRHEISLKIKFAHFSVMALCDVGSVPYINDNAQLIMCSILSAFKARAIRTL